MVQGTHLLFEVMTGNTSLDLYSTFLGNHVFFLMFFVDFQGIYIYICARV